MIDKSLLISLVSALAAVVSALYAHRTTKLSEKRLKTEYVFSLYKEIIQWLNNHKEARDWVYEPKVNEGKLKDNWDNWHFDDFLGYFEALWALKKKNAVDIELIYDLVSDYLVSMFEETNELKECIQQLRESYEKEKGAPSFYYEGVENLYKHLKEFEKQHKLKEL